MASSAAMARLRIATWNVWHRFGPWEERQPAIAATLAELRPDVLCLQETWEEEGGTSQPAELGRPLGLHHHATASRYAADGLSFGNAIVSRHPIRRHTSRPLPPHPDYEEWRTVLAVELDTPDGPLQVFTTHLNFLLDQSDVRSRQVAAVAALVAEWGHGRALPPVLTGDLNAEPSSDEVRALTGRAAVAVPGVVFLDAFEVAGEGPGATWDRRNPHTHDSYEPDRRIDYVLVGKPVEGGRGRVLACRRFGDTPVDGVWPSDHFGVVADLELAPA